MMGLARRSSGRRGVVRQRGCEGAGWRLGETFDPGSPSLDPWMPPRYPAVQVLNPHTFSRRLAAPESRAPFFYLHRKKIMATQKSLSTLNF